MYITYPNLKIKRPETLLMTIVNVIMCVYDLRFTVNSQGLGYLLSSEVSRIEVNL